MIIIRNPKKWLFVRKNKIKNKTLGFVPTMGALHEGHLSLIRRSKRENDLTCVSIFINPAQFNDKKDLKNYPASLESDIKKLKSEKTDFLFLPDEKTMYSDGYSFKVSENSIGKILCGKGRPGHFDGVLTIVMKLFNIARPDRAYFGEKDYQQYVLIKNMAEAFFMNIEIIPCPLIREKDGLALSSRNRLLNKKERLAASLLNKTLKTEKSKNDIKRILNKSGFNVEYVENKWGRKLAAAKLGKVRLIDNVKI